METTNYFNSGRNVDNNNETITTTEEVVRYSEDGKVLLRMSTRVAIDHLDIPEGVVEIGSNAFTECHINSVHIPESVIRIGKYAFSDSTIETVEFSEGLVQIGMDAFLGCLNLKELTIPNSVKRLGDNCFQDSGIVRLRFSDNIRKIPPYCCHRCHNLKEVEMPKNLVRINRYAFSECISLTSVIIPDVRKIGADAFNKCSMLERARIENRRGQIFIGIYAFSECENFVELTLAHEPKEISQSVFGYKPGVKITIEHKSLLTRIREMWNDLRGRSTLDLYPVTEQA